MVDSHRFYIIMYYFTIIELIVLTDFIIFIYDNNILRPFYYSIICKQNLKVQSKEN